MIPQSWVRATSSLWQPAPRSSSASRSVQHRSVPASQSKIHNRAAEHSKFGDAHLHSRILVKSLRLSRNGDPEQPHHCGEARGSDHWRFGYASSNPLYKLPFLGLYVLTSILGYTGRYLARYLHENSLTSEIRLVDKHLPELAWLAPEFKEACSRERFMQADASRERMSTCPG